ncbi:MAG: helix-hairpin-helix domain-containing protein [Bacteroidetes bacterium]|nr:helix-hairpin-helix domain-containing protein [Bacteroidota bacterium]
MNRNDNVQLIHLSVNPKVSSLEKEREDDQLPQEETKENLQSYSAERFVFNPNTVTQEEAMALGFSRKLSTTLINFRNKGGKFHKPEDLKKLYGVSHKLYNALEPYILIPGEKKELRRDTLYLTGIAERKVISKPLLEINTADSLSIVYLKGIGPGFTKRIIKYRTLLGGFHSLNQLKEIYGMNDSLFLTLTSQIQLNANAITAIPINSVDINGLKKHPYFNFQSAQALINYRIKHGKLTESIIKGMGLFNEEKLKLILPYLSY